MKGFRQTAGIAALVVALVVTVLIPAADAGAQSVDLCERANVVVQSDLTNKPTNCRYMVVDPGVGQILGRSRMLQADARNMYVANGFTDNFLWYAKETSLTVHQNDDKKWTGCLPLNSPGAVCTDIGTTSQVSFIDFSVFRTFDGANNSSGTGTVALDVFQFGDMWIARACGNWHNVPERPNTDDSMNPVPEIRIEKFDDKNRNGVRDPGEGPLDVAVTVTRESSLVGQDLEPVAVLTTGADGVVVFELDGHGPGTYSFTEDVPAGTFATTDTTVSRSVGFGHGEDPIAPVTFGNAAATVDVAKTAFEVNLPDSFEARTETPITVDVEITNNGPADFVPIRDEVFIVAKPEDCVLNEEVQATTATLRVGETITRTFTFLVTCDLPSNHAFTFGDFLEVTDSRLTETNDDNNEAVAIGDTEVHAFTTLSTTTDVDCPDRTYITDTFTCAVTTSVGNIGYGPIEVDVTTDVASEVDCAVPIPIERTIAIADGETATFVDDVDIVCANRSFHVVSAVSSVAAVDIHVFDAASPLERASVTSDAADDIIEVFERTDLSINDVDMFLVCTEYWDGDPFQCTGDVTWTNNGPADNVHTLMTATLSSPGCTATPDPQVAGAQVAAGSSASATLDWQVTCSDPGELHVLSFEACVANDPDLDPHAEDTDASNDCATVIALPIDFKPLSDPNSVRLGRGGVTSVAILSTASFNPFNSVDTSVPIFFGPTGTEAEATRCSSEGEDANNDGYDQDMTCKFRNRDLGLSAGDEIICMTGRLLDGTRFIGCDTVRVI